MANPLTAIPPKTQTNIMPTVQSVAASSTAYLDLPLGLRYHQLILAYGGTTFAPANMTTIRVKVNQEPIWAVSGAFVDMQNQFDKMAAASANSSLILNFERVGLRSGPARWSTAINAGLGAGGAASPQCPNGVRSFRLEIDINSAAVAPTLTVYAIVSQINPAQGLWMMRRETWYENVPGAGEYLFTHKYNADPLRPIISRVFVNDAGACSQFRWLANNQEIVNRTVGVNSQILQKDGFRTPQANYTAYDTGEAGNAANAVNAGQIAQLDLRYTFSGANAALPVYAETLGIAA